VEPIEREETHVEGGTQKELVRQRTGIIMRKKAGYRVKGENRGGGGKGARKGDGPLQKGCQKAV